MTATRFRVRLTSDAEPATGLGGGVTNSLVPRDDDGYPFLPGPHLKGLMRAALKEVASHRHDWKKTFERKTSVDRDERWPAPLLQHVFGCSDADSIASESKIRVDAAKLGNREQREPHEFIKVQSRTAIDAKGQAKETSLRTTESVPVGTEFLGTVHCDWKPDGLIDQAWRLSLLAISAVGGSRSRTGQCVVELLNDRNEPASPDVGQLLQRFTETLEAWQGDQSEQLDLAGEARLTAIDHLVQETTSIELIFAAATTVCFPEHPSAGNVINSGFCISSTAIQGVLLHLVNVCSESLATSLFNSSNFRCWPLTPCWPDSLDALELDTPADIEQCFDDLPQSIRVSLSHRAAKFTLGETAESHFFEPAVVDADAANDWRMMPDGIPLKSSDGVLLFGGNLRRSPQLWKSALMPRHLTTHGVVDGPATASETGSRRNLYSVEAMKPMCWRGIVAVPCNLADALVEAINRRQEYRIGKGRSVRGQGRLIARKIATVAAPPGDAQAARTALVLQSPVSIPSHLHEALDQGELSAEGVLRQMATNWLAHHGLPELDQESSVWATVGLRFGWNRHAKGFQDAIAVLQPGSVFSLAETPDESVLSKAILAGFYANPDQPESTLRAGTGCLARHPGVAVGFYQPEVRVLPQNSGELNQAMQVVWRMAKGASHLPRPSQIRGVQRLIVEDDPQKGKASLHMAIKHLKRQCERLPEIWHAWQPIADDVEMLLTNSDYSADVVSQALKSLCDLAIVHHQKSEAAR